jgi:hypothetical protein
MRGLPAPPAIGKKQLPQFPRKPRQIERGMREFIFPEQAPHTGGPGDPPAEFVGAKNSAAEWPPYWGLARIFGEPSPRLLRQPPYMGAPGIWEYQEYIPGGLMTTNIDFVVLPSNGLAQPTAIRIQTEFVHGPDAEHGKIAADIMYRNYVEAGYDVVDIWDFDYMADYTGEAIIQLLKEALGLIEPPNPLLSGRWRRVPA